MNRRKGRNVLRMVVVFTTVLPVFFLGLALGRYPAPGLLPFSLVANDPVARAVLFDSRLPRLVGAASLGAVMGAAGNAFQMVFANPIIEPGFLGVTQGAALGAALALVAGVKSPLIVVASAFVFAVAGLLFATRMARVFPFGGWVMRLTIAGIAVSAAFSAVLALVKFGADPLQELPDIAYWTMGSLAGVDWSKAAFMAIPGALSVLFLCIFRWRIMALSLDDGVASSLGLRTHAERFAVLSVASFGVAAVVSVAGTVSWVGLVVPHIARIVVGSDVRVSMPASAFIGGAAVVACDTIARVALPGELPLGAVTALLGVACFLALTATRRIMVTR